MTTFGASLEGARAQTPQMRVLMVTPRVFPYIGGIETHVQEVGKRMVARGIAVTVLSTDVSRKLPPSEIVDGMQFLRVPAYPADKDYYYAPAISRIIASGGPWDVIHCQGVHTFVPLLAMRAARRARLPYVLTFHGGGETTAMRGAIRRLQWRLLRPHLARAACLIGVSGDEAEYFRRTMALPPQLFTVVPNGASHLPVESSLRPPKQGDPQIVSVGRLERYKGHQRVIAAMPHILVRYPNARLRIVGWGPYEAELRELAAKLRVAECVDIGGVPPGDGEGMARAFLSADVVTLLSEHEGQGLAALEALSCRRPVVIAYATALRELADQHMARAVALDSPPEDVASAIIQQYEEPLLPQRFEMPSWDDCVDGLLMAYRMATLSVGRVSGQIDGGRCRLIMKSSPAVSGEPAEVLPHVGHSAVVNDSSHKD